jgi:hypothetical protein
MTPFVGRWAASSLTELLGCASQLAAGAVR